MSIATQVKRLQDVRNQIRAKMVSLGLSTNTDLLQDLANDLDEVAFRGDASTTLSTSTRSKTLGAGYYTGGTIKVPSDYFPVNSTNTTATAGTVLKDYKFVDSSGATVTGTIATADSSNVSGSVSGSDPEKITLTTEKTSGSSSTTATATAIVTKGLYTGSSNIEKDLTSQDFTATAEAALATSVTGTDKIPNPLPAGTVTITPNTDNTKRIYSDSTNKGFVTNIVLNAMDTSSVSSATTKDPGTDYANKTTVTPSLDKQYVKLTAGYLPNSKVTINAIPNQKKSSDVSVGVSASISDITSIDTSQSTSGVTVTASASGSVTVPLGYYSSAVTSNPTASDSTTIKPVLAASVTGTDKIPNPLPPGTVEITPNTDNTKRIYSDTTTNKGFITNVVLKPMDTSSVTIPDPNKDPGTDYANKATVTPSTSAQYIKITKGYLPNSKITINKMADGSVSSATTTNPGDSYTNKATVTPTKSTQYVKIAAGYLPNSKITVNAIPSATFTIATSAWSAMSSANETGSYTCTISGVTGVTATNDIVILPGNTSVVASCGVYASGQGASSITFKAFNKPSSNISYTVYILNS